MLMIRDLAVLVAWTPLQLLLRMLPLAGLLYLMEIVVADVHEAVFAGIFV